jgi:hypothetical protein
MNDLRPPICNIAVTSTAIIDGPHDYLLPCKLLRVTVYYTIYTSTLCTMKLTSAQMKNSERLYADLVFIVSRKYASWDPEIQVEVGDYGRITSGKRRFPMFWRKQGIFVKEGNIYNHVCLRGGRAENDNPTKDSFATHRL